MPHALLTGSLGFPSSVSEELSRFKTDASVSKSRRLEVQKSVKPVLLPPNKKEKQNKKRKNELIWSEVNFTFFLHAADCLLRPQKTGS